MPYQHTHTHTHIGAVLVTDAMAGMGVRGAGVRGGEETDSFSLGGGHVEVSGGAVRLAGTDTLAGRSVSTHTLKNGGLGSSKMRVMSPDKHQEASPPAVWLPWMNVCDTSGEPRPALRRQLWRQRLSTQPQSWVWRTEGGWSQQPELI